jgi:Na+/H+-translocating membrane pyrophosphatase
LTELGFIVALEIAGFVLSLTMARAAAVREPGASVYRIVSALERARQSFLARERRAAVGAALLVVAAVVATFALFGRIELALLVALGLAVGALLTFACSALAASSTGRAAGATHASARVGFNPALSASLRAGGSVGLGAESASTLGAAALFGVTYLAEGGRGSGAAQSLAGPCLVVAGYALGATLAALIVERAGSAYRVGAEAGKSRGAPDAAGDANDPRNPALVAGLVGDHVGSVASASAASFALSAVATAAVLACARAVGQSPDEELRAAALPLAIRSFGLVASAAGVLAARADEAQGQGFALLRGLACALAISLFGIAGGSYWLAEQNWWFFAVAGAFGLAAAAVPSLVLLSFTDRRARPVRRALDALRSGTSAAFGASVGHALERTIAPLVVAIAFALVAGALGERAKPSGGYLIGVAVFALSLISLAPYALAALGMSAVSRSARSITALSKVDTESAWRLQRLDDVGFAAAAPARAHLFTASAFAPLPGVAVALGALGASGFGTGGAVLAAVLGPLVVLAHAGQAAQSASRAVDEVAFEVERQLGGVAAGAAAGGGAAGGVPEGHAPSYRACEELTQNAASDGLFLGASWAVAPLVLLGIGLGIVYRIGGSRLAAAALSTIVATAAVTALGAALAVDGARTVHSGARRLARHERETASRAPIADDVLANILGIAAGPSASLQALLLASFALAVLELIP